MLVYIDTRTKRGLRLTSACSPRSTKSKNWSAVTWSQGKLSLGKDKVKQSLLFIDTDRSGKITKQEWMRFMEAEFDRIDKNKSGELNAKELAQSKLRVSHLTSVGK